MRQIALVANSKLLPVRIGPIKFSGAAEDRAGLQRARVHPRHRNHLGVVAGGENL